MYRLLAIAIYTCTLVFSSSPAGTEEFKPGEYANAIQDLCYAENQTRPEMYVACIKQQIEAATALMQLEPVDDVHLRIIAYCNQTNTFGGGKYYNFRKIRICIESKQFLYFTMGEKAVRQWTENF